MRLPLILSYAGIACVVLTGAAQAQQPISRADAVETAVARGPRLAIARADTAVARGQILTARAWPNPNLLPTYSQDTPHAHLLAEFPLDYPWLRRDRIHSAEASRRSSQYRFEFERAAVALDADTIYTRALAAALHARLSRRNAADADSLRRMAIVRRDAGDASDLDVALATVYTGQQENLAATDSLELSSTLLDLQAVMGMTTDRVAVAPTDSLSIPQLDSLRAGSGVPLEIASAQQALAAAELDVRVQRRSVFSPFAVTGGIEFGDPGGSSGLLPTFGIALPVPLFNRNQGPVTQAEAARERARAELVLSQVENNARVASLRRTRDIALRRSSRDRQLVTSADSVAGMSLVAYREGASSLPNVLEAQRTAREILGQYIDDLATLWIANATLRVFTLTTTSSPAGGQ